MCTAMSMTKWITEKCVLLGAKELHTQQKSSSRETHSNAFDMLCQSRKAVSAVHCQRGWNMGQTRDSWNQRCIYDVETPIPSPSKQTQSNATGKEEKGNRLLVLWNCACDGFHCMCWHCITVESYCSKLERLQQVICCTQPAMLHQHVINLHDNARPHTAWLQHCGWEATDNPPPNSSSLMTRFPSPYEAPTWRTICNRYWCETSCHLLYDDFFYSGTQSILSRRENAYVAVLISP